MKTKIEKLEAESRKIRREIEKLRKKLQNIHDKIGTERYKNRTGKVVLLKC